MLSVGIVGAGKVGTTLARLWYRHGVRIAAVASRDRVDAERLAAEVSAVVMTDISGVIRASDLTVICVPDDVLSAVAASVTDMTLAGKSIVHTSGVHDAAALIGLQALGAQIGGLHPVYPFADVETAIEGISGAVFAVETESSQLAAELDALVRRVGGQPMVIAPGGKSLYHAALVIASNYTVVLYAVAERLLMQIGAERQLADAALNGLLEGTIRNLRESGIPGALTGPLVREDVDTVRRHLAALQGRDSALADLYAALGRQALPLLEARGIDTQNVEHVLRRQ